MNLLTVGTVAFDKIETPFGKTDKILGGAATFIALTAAKLKVPAAIVSVIGEDFPDEYLQIFRNHEIDVSGIEQVKNGKTFFWHGRYHNDMNSRDTLATELNVLENFQPKVPENWQQPEVLMLGNLHPIVQDSVLNQLNQRPKLVVLDTMNFWMDHALEDLKKIIAQTDVLTINDEEARQLSGEYSLLKASFKILEMGPKYLVIKKGEHGALLFHDNQMFYVPALPLEEVFDPTGAGDTFAGGFCAYLAKTQDYSFENMKKAIVYGSALASFTVEKFGTEKLLQVTEEELNKRVAQFRQMTQF